MAKIIREIKINFTLYLHRYVLMALGPTQPPIQRVQEALSLGVKQPGHGADQFPSSVEVKNAWSYTSTLPNT